jgi:ketosteroid isomerase-like protein
MAGDVALHLEGTAGALGREEPYRGHSGVRQYLADVDDLWDELTVHAEDFRVVPGSVIVLGSVSGRRAGATVRRAAVWTWRLREGLVTYLRVADMGDLVRP